MKKLYAILEIKKYFYNFILFSIRPWQLAIIILLQKLKLTYYFII